MTRHAIVQERDEGGQETRDLFMELVTSGFAVTAVYSLPDQKNGARRELRHVPLELVEEIDSFGEIRLAREGCAVRLFPKAADGRTHAYFYADSEENLPMDLDGIT